MEEERYKRVISAIKFRAREILPSGSTVVLYGSRARGDAKLNSDWDLLIITKRKINSQKKFDKYISPFYELGWQIDEEINTVNYTVKEWEDQNQTLFYHNVMRDAIPIMI